MDPVGVEVRQPPAAEKTRWARLYDALKDLGPTFVALVSLAVTVIIAYLAYQVSSQQAATSSLQAATIQADLLNKYVAELNDPNDTQRDLAAIKLAAYGQTAWPTVRLLLGMNSGRVRDGAVRTVVLSFEGGDAERREWLFGSLKESFRASNPFLRQGVLECFLKLRGSLSESQKQGIFGILKEHLGDRGERSRTESAAVVIAAAQVVSLYPSRESIEILLGVLRHHQGEGPHRQAVNSLKLIAGRIPSAERIGILNGLRDVRPQASPPIQNMIDNAISEIQGMP